MSVVAIIQARMGSTRLPGKVLADIVGTPMLFRVIERVAAARSVDQMVVATTTSSEDDPLVKRLKESGVVSVFRGSPDDVLQRYFQCAKLYNADTVVRVTADDPLKDPGIIDHAVSILHGDESLDYCSNTIEPSYPEGLDIEVLRFASLARAHAEATLVSDREHVTPFIWRQPTLFRTHNFTLGRNRSGWRWTVDKPEDLEFARAVFTQFFDRPLVGYDEVMAWIEMNPQIARINAGTIRNEAYLNSLRSAN